MNYNYHRYYNNQIGRYTTPDPLEMDGGINFYIYSGNNPVNWVDAYGLWCGSGWKDYIIPDYPYGINLTDPCKTHDFCYDGKPPYKLKSKLECDLILYEEIMAVCKDQKSAYQADLCRSTALIYFWAVFFLGDDEYEAARAKSSATK